MSERCTDRLVTAVAAFPLASERSISDVDLDDDRFVTVLDQCAQHGTVALLGSAVRHGAIEISAGARRALEARLRAQYEHDLRVERTLLHAVGELTAAGVACRVLGATALARTVYARPELRALDEVELMVAPSDGARTQVICESLAVDDTAVALRVSTATAGEMAAAPYRFPLAGYELATLPMPHRLLHLCRTALPGDFTMSHAHARDIAEVVTRESPNLVDLLLFVRTGAGEHLLASAVAAAWDTLALTDQPPLVTWARRTHGAHR